MSKNRLTDLENKNKIENFGLFVIDYQIKKQKNRIENLRHEKYKIEDSILSRSKEIDQIKQKIAYKQINDLWSLK